MPLGGLLPYDDEAEFEEPVSPQFGDLTDLQEQGANGDRDLSMEGGDLLARLAKRRKMMQMTTGLPQMSGAPAGVDRFMEADPNMEAARAMMRGFNGR